MRYLTLDIEKIIKIQLKTAAGRDIDLYKKKKPSPYTFPRQTLRAVYAASEGNFLNLGDLRWQKL